MTSMVQWQITWKALKPSQTGFLTSLYEEILTCYCEPSRSYHGLQHLDECLEKFQELREFANHPNLIEIALYFHDAIYRPSEVNNEQLSAEWAQSSALDAGVDNAVARMLYKLVMATQHKSIPKTIDEKILVDVDLAILGSHPLRFKQYEQQIRQEYAFVPDTVFKVKRKAILQQFLARATLYNMPLFIERYEAQARLNLTEALNRL